MAAFGHLLRDSGTPLIGRDWPKGVGQLSRADGARADSRRTSAYCAGLGDEWFVHRSRSGSPALAQRPSPVDEIDG